MKKQILIYPMLDDRNVEVDPALAPFATCECAIAACLLLSDVKGL